MEAAQALWSVQNNLMRSLRVAMAVVLVASGAKEFATRRIVWCAALAILFISGAPTGGVLSAAGPNPVAPPHSVAFGRSLDRGMKSEILKLQWKHVDRNAGQLRLEPGTTKNRLSGSTCQPT